MNTYNVLIALSVLVIFSYLFDLFAKRTKFPSVLLLLGLGAILRQASLLFGIHLPNLSALLPALGSVGLILIVFEGALGLKFHVSKLQLIRKSFMASLIVLLTTSFVLSVLLYYLTNQNFYTCVVNSIPYCVISSAIAIPSISFLTGNKKEFIVYESSFSDILGIMLFNYTIANPDFSTQSLFKLASETVVLLLLSVLFCLLLMYLIGRITHHVKFFLVISIMILTYSIGKQYHLSTLIIVLVFGFFLANQNLIGVHFFKKHFQYDHFYQDFEQLEKLSAECAFLVRTFFFLLFGFTIDPKIMADIRVVEYGCCIMATIYLVRWAYLRWIAKMDLSPELFITPRGLISVLLFLSIPPSLQLAQLGEGVLIFVVLFSCIAMMLGLVSYRKV